MSVYVSVTGFRPKRGLVPFVRFWWHTWRSLRQVRRAPGLVALKLGPADGHYHTMTVWSDEASMRDYVRSGAHLRAMKGFRGLGSGRTLGFLADANPGWDAAYARFQREARAV